MNIRALGYFVAQTDNINQWKEYAEQVQIGRAHV